MTIPVSRYPTIIGNLNLWNIKEIGMVTTRIMIKSLNNGNSLMEIIILVPLKKWNNLFIVKEKKNLIY
jgi:hypothetical protein